MGSLPYLIDDQQVEDLLAAQDTVGSRHSSLPGYWGTKQLCMPCR